MRTQTKFLIGAGLGLGAIAWFGRRKPKRSSTTGGGGGRDGQGSGGGNPDDLDDEQKKAACRIFGRVYNAKLGRCVKKVTDIGGGGLKNRPGTGPKPQGPKLPAAEVNAAVAALCGAPLSLGPDVCSTLLVGYVMPAFYGVVGDELAPSASMITKANDAIAAALRKLCVARPAELEPAIGMFARAAEAMHIGSAYGQPIESETAIGRVCLWDGGGSQPLDTTQTLALIVDVALSGLRRQRGDTAIKNDLQACDRQPVSGTALAAMASGILAAAKRVKAVLR